MCTWLNRLLMRTIKNIISESNSSVFVMTSAFAQALKRRATRLDCFDLLQSHGWATKETHSRQRSEQHAISFLHHLYRSRCRRRSWPGCRRWSSRLSSMLLRLITLTNEFDGWYSVVLFFVICSLGRCCLSNRGRLVVALGSRGSADRTISVYFIQWCTHHNLQRTNIHKI